VKPESVEPDDGVRQHDVLVNFCLGSCRHFRYSYYLAYYPLTSFPTAPLTSNIISPSDALINTPYLMMRLIFIGPVFTIEILKAKWFIVLFMDRDRVIVDQPVVLETTAFLTPALCITVSLSGKLSGTPFSEVACHSCQALIVINFTVFTSQSRLCKFKFHSAVSINNVAPAASESTLMKL
jgi:hypothetical protein